MKNVTMTVEGDELVIRVDLTQEHGESSSKKSVIIATSEGNQDVPDTTNIKIGLNVYKPKQ
jgi:hypothetical protein